MLDLTEHERNFLEAGHSEYKESDYCNSSLSTILLCVDLVPYYSV